MTLSSRKVCRCAGSTSDARSCSNHEPCGAGRGIKEESSKPTVTRGALTAAILSMNQCAQGFAEALVSLE